MKTYSVHFNDSENRGSFAVDAIATTAEGSWTSSQDNFALIMVADENTEYLEEILNSDERVESYRQQ